MHGSGLSGGSVCGTELVVLRAMRWRLLGRKRGRCRRRRRLCSCRRSRLWRRWRCRRRGGCSRIRGGSGRCDLLSSLTIDDGTQGIGQNVATRAWTTTAEVVEMISAAVRAGALGLPTIATDVALAATAQADLIVVTTTARLPLARLPLARLPSANAASSERVGRWHASIHLGANLPHDIHVVSQERRVP